MQDRILLVKDKQLADYYAGLAALLIPFCLTFDGRISVQSPTVQHDNPHLYTQTLMKKINDYNYGFKESMKSPSETDEPRACLIPLLQAPWLDITQCDKALITLLEQLAIVDSFTLFAPDLAPSALLTWQLLRTDATVRLVTKPSTTVSTPLFYYV